MVITAWYPDPLWLCADITASNIIYAKILNSLTGNFPKTVGAWGGVETGQGAAGATQAGTGEDMRSLQQRDAQEAWLDVATSETDWPGQGRRSAYAECSRG